MRPHIAIHSQWEFQGMKHRSKGGQQNAGSNANVDRNARPGETDNQGRQSTGRGGPSPERRKQLRYVALGLRGGATAPPGG